MPPENDKSDDDKGGSDDKSASEAMQKAITDLAGNQGDLAKGLKSLSDNVVSLTQRLDKQNDSDDDDDDNGDVEETDLPDDLESLSMKEVISLMDKRGQERETRLIKSFRDEIGTANKKVDNASTRAELSEVQRNHEDFSDWTEQIGAVARANPELSIEDMYTLAKAKNPERVAKLEKEAKEAKEKGNGKGDDDDDNKSGKSRNRYGGGESRKGGDENRKTNMKQKEAGEAAYEEIFG